MGGLPLFEKKLNLSKWEDENSDSISTNTKMSEKEINCSV